MHMVKEVLAQKKGKTKFLSPFNPWPVTSPEFSKCQMLCLLALLYSSSLYNHIHTHTHRVNNIHIWVYINT